LEIAAHQHPNVVPGVARLAFLMPNYRLSAFFNAIWLEKLLFGMFWLFLVVLAEKKLFGMFLKPVCFELKLLVFSAFLTFIEAI